jgi:hypothetical protein
MAVNVFGHYQGCNEETHTLNNHESLWSIESCRSTKIFALMLLSMTGSFFVEGV